eukprot:5113305-Prymnesium_polylepis.1
MHTDCPHAARCSGARECNLFGECRERPSAPRAAVLAAPLHAARRPNLRADLQREALLVDRCHVEEGPRAHAHAAPIVSAVCVRRAERRWWARRVGEGRGGCARVVARRVSSAQGGEMGCHACASRGWYGARGAHTCGRAQTSRVSGGGRYRQAWALDSPRRSGCHALRARGGGTTRVV